MVTDFFEARNYLSARRLLKLNGHRRKAMKITVAIILILRDFFLLLISSRELRKLKHACFVSPSLPGRWNTAFADHNSRTWNPRARAAAAKF